MMLIYELTFAAEMSTALTNTNLYMLVGPRPILLTFSQLKSLLLKSGMSSILVGMIKFLISTGSTKFIIVFGGVCVVNLSLSSWS